MSKALLLNLVHNPSDEKQVGVSRMQSTVVAFLSSSYCCVGKNPKLCLLVMSVFQGFWAVIVIVAVTLEL